MPNINVDEEKKAIILTLGDNDSDASLQKILKDNEDIIKRISNGEFSIIVDARPISFSTLGSDINISKEYYDILTQMKFKNIVIVAPKNIFIRMHIKKLIRSISAKAILVRTLEEAYKYI